MVQVRYEYALRFFERSFLREEVATKVLRHEVCKGHS